MCKNHKCDMKQVKIGQDDWKNAIKGFINGMLGGALLWLVVIAVYQIVPW